jgi:hypothetical protein
LAYLQMLKLYLGALSRYWSAWNVNLAIVPAYSGEIKDKWTCGLIPTKGRIEARDKFSSTFFMNCKAFSILSENLRLGI